MTTEAQDVFAQTPAAPAPEAASAETVIEVPAPAKPPRSRRARAQEAGPVDAMPPVAEAGDNDSEGLYICIQNIKFKVGDKARFDRNPDPRYFRRVGE